ncbi:MAG: hypothetical protein ACLT98_09430 [Eggerthellaceae bacterium]
MKALALHGRACFSRRFLVRVELMERGLAVPDDVSKGPRRWIAAEVASRLDEVERC